MFLLVGPDLYEITDLPGIPTLFLCDSSRTCQTLVVEFVVEIAQEQAMGVLVFYSKHSDRVAFIAQLRLANLGNSLLSFHTVGCFIKSEGVFKQCRPETDKQREDRVEETFSPQCHHPLARYGS